jgi:outer membrane protein assembly factor BamB
MWTLIQPIGPDFDFGAGPNLFTTANPVTGRPEQLLGAGQKSGVYWAVDPATGKVVWQTRVGPAGILYGTATDGRRIYAADGDFFRTPYTLGGSGPYAGQTVSGGSWTAMDPATGKILWQTPDPQGAVDASFVSAANAFRATGRGQMGAAPVRGRAVRPSGRTPAPSCRVCRPVPRHRGNAWTTSPSWPSGAPHRGSMGIAREFHLDQV